LDFSSFISGSVFSCPFLKHMSSYFMRRCRLWFLNISPSSWINCFLLSLRSSYNNF
jgi:hypothetical protein